MSSPYPVLGTKPIDQWKVTELKEELKRRRLKTNGLKDDLIRRLDDALRVEMENDEALRTERESVKALRSEQKNAAKAVVDVDNGVHLENPPIVGVKMEEAVPVVAEMVKDVVDDAANRDEKVDNVMIQVGTTEIVTAMGTGELQEEVQMGGIDSSSTDEDLNVHASTVETSITVTESVVSEVALSVKATGTGELQEEVQMGGIDSSRKEEDLNVHATTVETSITVAKSVVPEVALSGQDVQNSGTQEANENSNIQLENEGLKPQLENESLKPPDEDATLDSSAPDNQVSEVSPSLGFQVKSDSISTDSVSINEKIELKDNIIADHVKLELDNVKPEMVEPSFSNVVPVGGESHPMDVEEPQEKRESVEEKDDSSGANAYMSKNNDSVDVGYSEKLNLDRSSGDDSMEEDVLESKQIDSKYNSDEVGDGSEKKNEGPVVKEENLVGVAGKDLSTDQKEVHVENKIHPVVPVEKRKFNDQEIVGNSEPLKRQRRWNSENIKVPEQQSSNLTPTTTPKDGFQPAPLRRNFSRSESSVSEEAPKERVVPPSQKPVTNSLRIDRFLRPFTLKAVQELLGKTGSVTSFWMDHIKTHCYVTYSSVEEATETRNAVYNLQWPPNGGRLLVAEFVDPQEVKMRVDAPPQSPSTPVTPSAAAPAPPTLQPQPSPRQQVSRQQLPPPPSLPPPPPLTNPPHTRERVDLPPPPPLPEKHDPPIVTLDDLFRKTKTAPRIYYLPLLEEQVAAKLAERGKNTKQ
ncbi:apoptotic chromatin condensation inducer in the nucleus-like [Populus alba x Populus x berolinensis]|nr:apoptotic chromatin condensation inducer in the nucleus-like [Populus alba x Populus x berolinensis]